jgi:hypothetical protein
MPVEGWTRRRDLEGGKQIGVWLAEGSAGEVYVEDLTYRDAGYESWLYDADADEWTAIGHDDDPEAAFERALAWMRERGGD